MRVQSGSREREKKKDFLSLCITFFYFCGDFFRSRAVKGQRLHFLAKLNVSLLQFPGLRFLGQR